MTTSPCPRRTPVRIASQPPPGMELFDRAGALSSSTHTRRSRLTHRHDTVALRANTTTTVPQAHKHDTRWARARERTAASTRNVPSAESGPITLQNDPALGGADGTPSSANRAAPSVDHRQLLLLLLDLDLVLVVASPIVADQHLDAQHATCAAQQHQQQPAHNRAKGVRAGMGQVAARWDRLRKSFSASPRS